jgi:hypothetical protein
MGPKMLLISWSERLMQGENQERWFQLCQQAAVETDPAKMLALVREINDLLDEKEARLNQRRKLKDDGEPPVLPKEKRNGSPIAQE